MEQQEIPEELKEFQLKNYSFFNDIVHMQLPIRYDDVIRDDDYILKCTANRLKSDNEYCLTIVDSSVDFGSIETLTFIREDSE